MATIIDRDNLIKRRVNGASGLRSGLYFDSFKGGSYGEGVPGYESTVVPASERWVNSEAFAKLWSDIEDTRKKVKNQLDRRTNVATFPEDYYDLIDKLRLDITRRRMEEMDLAPEMTQEIVNPAFSKSVSLDEFLPYAGAFESMTGANNSVPLIQAKTGATGSVAMTLYGLGFTRTLEDELYNTDIFSLQKVQDAVTRAHTALRNDLTIGQLVAKTTASGWDSSQQVAATSGSTTAAEDLYDTINTAIDTLMNLLDPQTEQEISAPQMVLACRPADVRRINRAINGQLADSPGEPANFRALTEITEIWPYRGDTLYVGEKTVTYSGIADDTAYLFVPGPAGAPAWTLTKRGLTQEVGRGDILQLAREQRAWYFAQGEYLDEFFGSSATGTSLGSGYGFVVEVTLPTES